MGFRVGVIQRLCRVYIEIYGVGTRLVFRALGLGLEFGEYSLGLRLFALDFTAATCCRWFSSRIDSAVQPSWSSRMLRSVPGKIQTVSLSSD